MGACSLFRSFIFLSLFFSALLYAEESGELDLEIDVLGLFKGSAMLNIGGEETLLKEGQRSKQKKASWFSEWRRIPDD